MPSAQPPQRTAVKILWDDHVTEPASPGTTHPSSPPRSHRNLKVFLPCSELKSQLTSWVTGGKSLPQLSLCLPSSAQWGQIQLCVSCGDSKSWTSSAVQLWALEPLKVGDGPAQQSWVGGWVGSWEISSVPTSRAARQPSAGAGAPGSQKSPFSRFN